MTLEQVYVLNRALDGKDIYSIPTFAGLEMTEMSIQLVKDTLVENGILLSHSSFSTKGLELTKNIFDYKNARKYIEILDLVLGIIDDKKAVMLEAVKNNYTFTLINIVDSLKQLSSVYEFLSLDTQNTGCSPVGPAELLSEYKLNSKNSFNFMTIQNDKKTTEIYFSDGSSIFVYDCDDQLLYQKNADDIKQLLRERMAI